MDPHRATPPGWYRDPHGGVRWWDGRQWTTHAQPPPAPPVAQPQVVVMPAAQPRKYVTRGVSGSEQMLHLVLTFMTCGLWLPVWIIRSLAGKHRQVAKY